MKITNREFVKCSKCGAEAYGMTEIDNIFGYAMKKENIMPNTYCAKCRESQKIIKRKKQREEKQWKSAAGWGKRIHISRKIFESYLVDLGYLKSSQPSAEGSVNMVMTEKGKCHSAITNAPFSKVVLWDDEAYVDVIQARAEKAVLHVYCPICKTCMDVQPGFDCQAGYRCRVCDTVAEHWCVDAEFDR